MNTLSYVRLIKIIPGLLLKVGLDSDDNENKVREILNDSNTYEQKATDPTEKICQGRPKRASLSKRKKAKSHNNCTKGFTHVGAHLFCLFFLVSLKFDKPGNPLRPIVFSFNSHRAKIGNYLSVVFRPLLQAQKFYIKNSADFVFKLKQVSVKPNTRMDRFDAN